jgi:hypothetical protein
LRKDYLEDAAQRLASIGPQNYNGPYLEFPPGTTVRYSTVPPGKPIVEEPDEKE